MSLKKRPYRCGCNNAALQIPNVTGSDRLCCDACVGTASTCTYSIMSDCDIYDGDELVLQKCTLLIKDCITGCTWSSRFQGYDPAGTTTLVDDLPITAATVSIPLVQTTYCNTDICNRFVETVENCIGCEYDCLILQIDDLTGFPEEILNFCNDSYPPITIRLVKTGCSTYEGAFCCDASTDIPVCVIGRVRFEPSYTVLSVIVENPADYRDSVCMTRFLSGVSCYSGTAGTAPTQISDTPYSFDIGADDWDTLRTGFYCNGLFNYVVRQAPSMSGSLSAPDSCYVGTAGIVATRNISSNVQIAYDFSSCHWEEQHEQGGPCGVIEWASGKCGQVPPRLDRGYTGTAGTASIPAFMKWIMTLSDGNPGVSASLLYRSLEGYSATYSGAAGSCTEKINFSRSTVDSPIKYMPLNLCVVPIETAPPSVCNTPDTQCTCCEDGDDMRLWVCIDACDPYGGCFDDLRSTRVAAGTYVDCGIASPDSSQAPCGFFPFTLGDVTDPTCPVAAKLIVYCNGTDYTIDVYCYDGNTNCWVSQGSATVTNYECTCYGPYFEFALPSLDCCCPAICPTAEEAEEFFPELTITLSSTCADFDGCTGTLTYNMGSWSGNIACGPHTVTIAYLCPDALFITGFPCNDLNPRSGTLDEMDTSTPALTATFPDAPFPDDGTCCSTSGFDLGAVITL